MTGRPTDILIVGAFSGTHLGASLSRAASRLGLVAACVDASLASSGPRIGQALSWRLSDHRPLRWRAFNRRVVSEADVTRPTLVIVTGSGPIEAETIRVLQSQGALVANISTDDPWNPAHRSRWHRKALPGYDIVFTPRRRTIADFQALGCADVRWLPFGYDDELFAPSAPPSDDDGPDLLFVGGADGDRVRFMTDLREHGLNPTLAGGYWERHPGMRDLSVGLLGPEALRVLTAAAKVNLCLVRRANRDGHVMRSFEIAATGGCMLAEDTEEHRAIFGPDGDCVAYFSSAEMAADRAGSLIADSGTRRRMAHAVVDRVRAGRHTYVDRLRTIAQAAGMSVPDKASRDA